MFAERMPGSSKGDHLHRGKMFCFRDARKLHDDDDDRFVFGLIGCYMNISPTNRTTTTTTDDDHADERWLGCELRL